MAENDGTSKQKAPRVRYKKSRRELFKKELHKLIVEDCLTNTQIAIRTRVPIRTAERWISEFYQERNQELLTAFSTEHALSTMNRVRDRLERHKQRILSTIEDSDRFKDASLAEYIEAMNLVCELEISDMKFFDTATEAVARRTALSGGASMPALMSTEPFIITTEEEEKEKDYPKSLKKLNKYYNTHEQ